MRRILFSLLVLCWLPPILLAQPQFITSLYPTQHALNVPADTVLRVGLQTPLDPASLSDSSIYVWSDITGLHRLTVTLENGNRELRITPSHWRLNDRPAFNAGERVTVTLTTRLRYEDGRQFDGFTWHYTVAVRQNFGGDFRPEALFGGGGSTYFNASDFNGDGWPDLIGNDDGIERKMIVFLNDGKGVLNFSHKDNIISPNAEVADLDRDGDQDIAYAGDYLIFNDGQANFTVKHFPERPNGFAKAHDFNNDGIMDFAIGSAINDTMAFGLSENERAFAKRYFSLVPVRPEFYYTGISYDLNNDGHMDLIHNGFRSSSLFGFVSYQSIGNDNANFSQFLDTRFQILNFYGNDFDGDRYIDYAMVGGGSGRNIQFHNDGRGILVPEGLQVDTTQITRLREAVTGGDFDGDGDIDLAFANSNQVGAMSDYKPDVCIYSNNGHGDFVLSNRISLPFNRPISNVLIAADLDRDGDLDLIGIANGLFYVVANGSYATSVSSNILNRLPVNFLLKPSYPNPFAEETRTEVTLIGRERREIIATIFNVSGRMVRTQRLYNKQNTFEIVWDGRDQYFRNVPNGIYFLNVRMGKNRVSQKLLLLR